MNTFLYNPDRKGKDLLISEFVVRTQVYDEIMHDLETSKMKHPEQHYLLVGQRGAGKTTLLNRIKYGIEDSENLNSWLIPILFTEEQYNITELANLWENIAQYLEDYHGFTGLSSEVEKHLNKSNFEELAFDLLEKYLTKYKKKLVLLIDNIGDLMQKLDKTEVHRLREILQTKKEIRLIAGSPFYLESILDYQQPFFEFFKVKQLNSLNQHETKNLLLKLAEIHDKKAEIERIIKETPERILTLRTLTGGVPRTIVLMFNVFIDYNDEGSVKDLERILDAVTPLYKHRMDDLPTQQQKIIDAVAKNWDAISVKELKEKVRLDSKTISAQLRQLEKNQVIEKKETATKNHLYLLKERFFNIWYLMRYGRKDDRQRVIWLVRFLESWCSPNDLESRVLDYIKKLNSGILDNNSKELFGQVYAAFSGLDTEVKFLLKKSVPKNISSKITITEEEVYNILEKNEEAENWSNILQITQNTYYSTNRVKLIILKAISKLYSLGINDETIMNILSKVDSSNEKNIDNNGEITLNETELVIIRSIVYFHLFNALLSDEFEDVKLFANQYIQLLEERDFGRKNLEYIILNRMFTIIMAQGHYNLVLKIFDSNESLNLKEIFKPIYYSLILLKEGENSPEFLKAGPELKEVINKIIEEVKEYRNNKNLINAS